MNPEKEEELRFIAQIVAETLDERRSISEEAHRSHHAFLDAWIEEIEIKKERREKVKTQVVGWGIITILGGIGTGAYHLYLYVIAHLH